MNETSSTTLDQDRAEIIAVIEEEVSAWGQRDVERMKACWVQDERLQHITARITTGARIMRGFDMVEAYFTAVFQEMSGQEAKAQPVRCVDWRVSIGADMAWVTLDHVNLPEGFGPGRINQLKILEKHSGRWKIVASFGIANRIGYYKFPWVQVDRNASIIDRSPGADEAFRNHGALQLVGKKLVGRRTPDNDKLREALSEADDLIRRMKMRAPRPLVLTGPEDDQVSLCWITIADMIIVVLVGDDTRLTGSIGAAGKVYQLSAAQIRVAEAIAQGKSLKMAAAHLGVRPNTVHTHVRRMFKRVNVNSQPALVRALLSVDAPYS